MESEYFEGYINMGFSQESFLHKPLSREDLSTIIGITGSKNIFYKFLLLTLR